MPNRYVEHYVLSRGRIEGEVVILVLEETQIDIEAKFSALMPLQFNLVQLKASNGQWPEGFVDYVLARGKIEGEVVILNPEALKDVSKKFPDLGKLKLNIPQLKANAAQRPEGFADYVLARGKIEGDLVILDPETQKDIRKKFPDLGQVKLNITQLKASAAQRPEGFITCSPGKNRGRSRDFRHGRPKGNQKKISAPPSHCGADTTRGGN